MTSYSTQENNSVGVNGGGGGFMHAMSNFGKGLVHGENGAIAHSMHNMAGHTNTDIQGALVAAFNGMLRDTSEERVQELLDNVRTCAATAGGNFEIETIVDTFVMWAHCRDRNNGKGERLVSYHMFIYLYDHFPKTALMFVSKYPELGYWKDLSQIYLIVNSSLQLSTRLLSLTETQITNRTSLLSAIIQCFSEQLLQDEEARIAGDTCSLCAKYVPKEGRSFDKKTKITKKIVKALFREDFKKDFRVAMKMFRKMYSRLNKYIDTVEIKECSGKWGDIDFNRVPGRALNIKRKAYLNIPTGKDKGDDIRHPDNADRMKCRENFQTHLQKAVTGEIKVKGKMMFIHELVEQIYTGKLNSPEEKLLVEAQWNTHVDAFREKMKETGSSLGKGICIVDVSGSMNGTPMYVAIAMGIFASGFAHPLFRDCFISFDSTPRWIRLTYPKTYGEYSTLPGNQCLGSGWNKARAGGKLSLCEKVLIAAASPWGGSTDFVAAHELILKSCVDADLPAEDMPEWLMILSDMQFNAAFSMGGNTYSCINKYAPQRIGIPSSVGGYSYYRSNIQKPWNTIHDNLSAAYHRAGVAATGTPYEMPMQIYWNLRGDTVGFPVQSDTPNTQIISGFSVALLKLFLEEADVSNYKEKERPVVTPWDTFRKAVDSENYYMIRQICGFSKEGVLSTYEFVEPEPETE
jgi:hypothetical protein